MRPEPVSLEEANTSRELGKQPQTYLRGGGTLLFKKPSPTGSMASTATAPGPSMTTEATAFGCGFSQEAKACTPTATPRVTHPAGEFSTNIEPSSPRLATTGS